MDSDVKILRLREVIAEGRIHWHSHALARFLERGISRSEILNAVLQGEIIETYPTDRPYPSYLFFGNDNIKPVHVVVAVDLAARIGHVVTAYRPDLAHFETDLKTRRTKI